jgi:hypothetical protein
MKKVLGFFDVRKDRKTYVLMNFSFFLLTLSVLKCLSAFAILKCKNSHLIGLALSIVSRYGWKLKFKTFEKV